MAARMAVGGSPQGWMKLRGLAATGDEHLAIVPGARDRPCSAHRFRGVEAVPATPAVAFTGPCDTRQRKGTVYLRLTSLSPTHSLSGRTALSHRLIASARLGLDSAPRGLRLHTPLVRRLEVYSVLTSPLHLEEGAKSGQHRHYCLVPG